MQAPTFWHSGDHWAAYGLHPIAWLYQQLNRCRQWKKPYRAKAPVICIGNVVAGGAGKTPTTQAIYGLLKHSGKIPHILTRGYGGSLKGPVQVDNTHHAGLVGDEAILHASVAPCWVARDRAKGAEAAANAGANVVLMDDGFQNPSLHQDVKLLVVDGPYGLGNGRTLPAGPLREPWRAALQRADAVIIIGQDAQKLGAQCHDTPVFQAEIQPDPEVASRLEGRDVLAFAGIGRPEKFFHTLRKLGARVQRSYAFADHAPYTKTSLKKILHEAETEGMMPVTTLKDMVRIPPQMHAHFMALPIALTFHDTHAIQQFLQEKLG
jgi:tetraacyldisaccharide 4'-kinase